MNRSNSYIEPSHQPNRSKSFRLLYHNHQISPNTKDISTIFHSPYKGGRKNSQYTNPSFTSSTVFYPDQIFPAKNCSNKHIVKANIVQNQNQLKKNELYEKRIKPCIQDVYKGLSKVMEDKKSVKVRKFNEISEKDDNDPKYQYPSNFLKKSSTTNRLIQNPKATFKRVDDDIEAEKKRQKYMQGWKNFSKELETLRNRVAGVKSKTIQNYGKQNSTKTKSRRLQCE